ncbi:hypothetical protein [Allorhizocola rhizosphaerae]|uniref:hypothetical protein n=1 Tax=Allorhizocola rhizosphaerae TaxID=1872709 RepID=UPI000E3B98EF|nr:hypothetical protein [Allorhizocola rhizosphaerae]
MTIMMKDDRPDELSEARSILLVHQPEGADGGLCRGCYEFACHFAWWPCPQVRWAQALISAENEGRQV